MNGLRPPELGHAKVRYAAVANFAFLHQIGNGGPAFFNVFVGIGPVDLVEINDVNVQTAQAVFRFAADAGGL